MRPSFIKHVLDLRAVDFERHPIWANAYNTDLDEPWYDDDPADEATYRPWEGTPPYDCGHPDARPPRVAARFRLSDGTELPGCCYPPTPGDRADTTHIQRMQPLLFLGDSPVGFWAGASERMLVRQRDRLYQHLGKRADDVFPIRYEIARGLINIDFNAQIEGFGRLLPPEYRSISIER